MAATTYSLSTIEGLANWGRPCMDKAKPADKALLRHVRKRRQIPDLDRGVRLRADRHRQKASSPRGLAANPATDLVGHRLRKNAAATSAYRYSRRARKLRRDQSVEFVHVLTGR